VHLGSTRPPYHRCPRHHACAMCVDQDFAAQDATPPWRSDVLSEDGTPCSLAVSAHSVLAIHKRGVVHRSRIWLVLNTRCRASAAGHKPHETRGTRHTTEKEDSATSSSLRQRCVECLRRTVPSRPMLYRHAQCSTVTSSGAEASSLRARRSTARLQVGGRDCRQPRLQCSLIGTKGPSAAQRRAPRGR